MTSVLNIRCGSDIREKLVEAGIEGDFLEYSDPICRGPVPANPDDDVYRSFRAEFIADNWEYDREETLEKLAKADARLDRASEYDIIVLWFEHDAYDQTILIKLLNRLSKQPDSLERMRLIQIDRFDGVQPFNGLGQLSAEQLATLPQHAVPVTWQMVESAREAYAAYVSNNPLDIVTIARRDIPGLPFLRQALVRMCLEYPAAMDGLSLTERLTLQAIASGAKTPAQCFFELYYNFDPQPFLGDLMYWDDIERLADAPEPAIEPIEDWKSEAKLTSFGRALLNRSEDWVTRNGIDRWIGGVHLAGDPDWRWSPSQGLVRV
ncbi:MAG: DUF1835 domain-containing protein [Alphaproteobacteria bacterium]